MNKKLLLVIFTIIMYWIIKNTYLFGGMFLYPINLLVTFFHETGHAFFALITGGGVHNIQINADGSGFARISGGINLLTLPGGYIGSALWGNLLLYFAFNKVKYCKIILYFLMATLIFTAFIWFNSIGTTLLLIGFASILYIVSKASEWIISAFLTVIGTSSLLYIITDFYGGPSSDLSRFTQILPILPTFLWAIVWLLVVMLITYKVQINNFKIKNDTEIKN